jgi:hypothetical protein
MAGARRCRPRRAPPRRRPPARRRGVTCSVTIKRPSRSTASADVDAWPSGVTDERDALPQLLPVAHGPPVHGAPPGRPRAARRLRPHRRHHLAHHGAGPGAGDADALEQLASASRTSRLAQRNRTPRGRAGSSAPPRASCRRPDSAAWVSASAGLQTNARAGFGVALRQPGATHTAHAARRFGQRARTGLASTGLGSSTPAPVDQAYKSHRQQQVGRRAGRHDGRARTQRLGVESQVPLGRVDRGFALVEHAHIATQRQAHSTNSVGLALALPAQQGLPKPTEKRSTLTPQATATR